MKVNYDLTKEARNKRFSEKRVTVFKYRYKELRSIVNTIIFNKYFYTNTDPGYTLNSGVKSKYYFDTRHLLLKHEHAPLVGNLFKFKIMIDAHVDGIPDLENIMVGGLETGAILLTTSIIQQNIGVDGFYVRKQVKEHGNDKLVVTPTDLTDKKIIIVDDIQTSGESIYKAIKSVKHVYPNSKVWKVYTLIDRSVEFDFNPFEKFWTDDLQLEETSFFSVFDSGEDFINLGNKYKI